MQMDFADFWLPIIGAGLLWAVAVSAWFADHKIVGIWSGFAASVPLLLLLALQLQHATTIPNSGVDDASVRQQRAHVYAIQGDVVHSPGSPPIVSVQIKNTGQTPALDLTWRAIFAVAPPSEANNIVVDQSLVASKTTLPPDGILSYEYRFENWNQRFDEMLKEGTAVIFAVGAIRYKDIFGNDRFTNYRLVSGGRFGISTGIAPGKFGAASGGNNSN